jgi:SAM-dependent methyltransferase
MTDRPPLSAEVFDIAFRDAAASEWTQRVFGADLPLDVDPFSFITLDGLRDIAVHLADCRGGTLLDLACGRGGPGLWLARHIGADLIGVDFSSVGIDHARAKAAGIAATTQTRYVVADAADTKLSGDSVNGIVCVDAIQLMSDKTRVMAEVCRVLKPGARAAFTTWEEPERLSDVAALFEAVGLVVVSVEDRPEWLTRERAIFVRALADAPLYPQDAALQSLAQEAETALPHLDRSRRVLGVAQKPHG